jgi:hypothetical protein
MLIMPGACPFDAEHACDWREDGLCCKPAKEICPYWSCGHKRTMVPIAGGAASISRYARFREHNPNNLCWKCWNEERAREAKR